MRTCQSPVKRGNLLLHSWILVDPESALTNRMWQKWDNIRNSAKSICSLPEGTYSPVEKKDNEIYNDNAVFTKLHDQGCLGYCEHTQNLVLSQSWDIRERFCGDYLPLNLGAKGYINVSSKKERGECCSRKMGRHVERQRGGEEHRSFQELEETSSGGNRNSEEGSGNGIRSQRALIALGRKLAFILREMESCWEILSNLETWSVLHFRKMPLYSL